MTKIYLVEFVNNDVENGFFSVEAFTNLQKAENYKRYWEAKCKNEGCNWTLSIRTLKIQTMNYLKWAIEEEMKQLPY